MKPRTKQSLRKRVFVVCLLISLAGVAVVLLVGFACRGLLSRQGRSNCMRIAAVAQGMAQERINLVVADTASIVQAFPCRGDEGGALGLSCRAPSLCAWAVYDAQGCRVTHEVMPSVSEEMRQLGIGAPRIVARERTRLAEALAGRASILLMPCGHRVYVLNYQPLPASTGRRGVVQAVGEVSHAMALTPVGATGSRTVLRPFMSSVDGPEVMAIDGQPNLVVHRPVAYQGRHLGTVSAAVPCVKEAQFVRVLSVAVGLVTVATLALLGLASHRLSGVALQPLTRANSLVSGIQKGNCGELDEEIEEDEVRGLLTAYRRKLSETQQWADRLMASHRAARELFCGAARALVCTIEAKDGYTAGHSERVAETAATMARELGWGAGEVDNLRLAALLHDMGKVGVRECVLDKPGRLTEDEFDQVRQHPSIGAHIVRAIPGCEDIIPVVLHHHERYRGRGYPSDLEGNDIPVAARIVTIADVYDALTTDRSYRPAYPPDEAIAIMKQDAARMFDPKLFEVFLRLWARGALAVRPAADADRAAPSQPAEAAS